MHSRVRSRRKSRCLHQNARAWTSAISPSTRRPLSLEPTAALRQRQTRQCFDHPQAQWAEAAHKEPSTTDEVLDRPILQTGEIRPLHLRVGETLARRSQAVTTGGQGFRAVQVVAQVRARTGPSRRSGSRSRCHTMRTPEWLSARSTPVSTCRSSRPQRCGSARHVRSHISSRSAAPGLRHPCSELRTTRETH